MRWSRESGDLLFSLGMTTFAMDVETPPLYKDLETWYTCTGSLFLQFLSAFCLIVKQVKTGLICN